MCLEMARLYMSESIQAIEKIQNYQSIGPRFRS
jgi:hypothetical protein